MQKVSTVPSATVQGNHHDEEFGGLLARIQYGINAAAVAGQPLLTTDATGLWEAYLGAFDGADRQYHNCTACRRFIERFGGLVTVDAQGRTASAIWDELAAPDHYRDAIAAVAARARRAKVTGVFLSTEVEWGTRDTGPWRHLSITPPAAMVYRRTTLSAGQKMAEKREDFGAVCRALADYTPAQLGTAVRLLESEAMYRSDKILGQAKWLADLKAETNDRRGAARSNLIWRAVALAPAGFCHPRSGMIGTLLDDIAADMSFEQVSSRFADKMNPLRYQRPQAAPTAGAVRQAEKIVADLGAAGSLARRFCRLDEVQALWRPIEPRDAYVEGSGVFGHLKTKDAPLEPSMRIPAQTMTWEKFARTVLPTAERIEIEAPIRGSYTALVTAVNADAPPILQWDREDARNPVSWYFWSGGASASQFGVASGRFIDVEAITLKPSLWHNDGTIDHHGAGVMFVMAGARESRDAGAAIFPEILRSEFHGIRSVLEAYSASAKIEGMDEPHAAGLMFGCGKGDWNARVRVHSGGQVAEYRLDRWD